MSDEYEEAADKPRHRKEDKHTGLDKDEKLEKICLQEFGFSYTQLEKLYETLCDVKPIITYYMEHTIGSDEDRKNLARLSIEVDTLALKFYELSCTLGQFMVDAERVLFFKQPPKTDKKQAEQLCAQISQAEQKLCDIITKTRQHVEKLAKIRTAGE